MIASNSNWSLKYFHKWIIVAVVIGCFHEISVGQDPQFSQQLSSPLLLNPAMSGADNNYRGAIIYRTQWNAVSDPFTTVAGSFDLALNQQPDPRKTKRGKSGLGIAFVSDRGGSPKVNHTNILLTGAYHVYLNRSSNLGAGLYLGYGSQSLDGNDGKWGSQYNGMQYSPDIPHGENIQALQQSALDVGGGLVYVFRKPVTSVRDFSRRELTIGVAGYHLGQVPLSDDNIFSDREQMRISAFARAAFGLGSSRSSLEPAVYFHRQGPLQMVMAGMAFRNVFSEGSAIMQKSKTMAFSIGGYYRFGDAAVANVFFEWSELAIGLAYDINTSSLSEYSSGQGAVEVTLRYQVAASRPRR